MQLDPGTINLTVGDARSHFIILPFLRMPIGKNKIPFLNRLKYHKLKVADDRIQDAPI